MANIGAADVNNVQRDSAAWPASINGTMITKCLLSRTEICWVSVQGVWGGCGERKWENRARTGAQTRKGRGERGGRGG